MRGSGRAVIEQSRQVGHRMASAILPWAHIVITSDPKIASHLMRRSILHYEVGPYCRISRVYFQNSEIPYSQKVESTDTTDRVPGAFESVGKKVQSRISNVCLIFLSSRD